MKWVERFSHRPLLPPLFGLGKMVLKTRWVAMFFFILVMVPAFLAQSNNEFYYGSSKLFGPDTEPGQQQEVVEEAFGDSNTFVLLVPNGDLAKEREVNVQLLQQPQIIDVISYANTVGTEIPMEYLDENILSKLISQHYSCMVMTANVPLSLIHI